MAGRASMCPLSRWAVGNSVGSGVQVRRIREEQDKVERYRKFSFYRSAPLGLGPQRGLKRHDLQESDVRHCYLAVRLVRSGLTRFFHLCYPEPTGATTYCVVLRNAHR